MLRFEGDREYRQAPAELWARLSDARFLAQCIPDVETVRLAEAVDHAYSLLVAHLALMRVR